MKIVSLPTAIATVLALTITSAAVLNQPTEKMEMTEMTEAIPAEAHSETVDVDKREPIIHGLGRYDGNPFSHKKQNVDPYDEADMFSRFSGVTRRDESECGSECGSAGDRSSAEGVEEG